MNTPVTPKSVKSFIDANKAIIEANQKAVQLIDEGRSKEIDGLVEELNSKIEAAEKEAAVPESLKDLRKRARDLKEKGYSNKDIAEIMRKPESSVRKFLQPYEPKPHLTQKIEGLEKIRREMNKQAHPAGRNFQRKRNGGK